MTKFHDKNFRKLLKHIQILCQSYLLCCSLKKYFYSKIISYAVPIFLNKHLSISFDQIFSVLRIEKILGSYAYKKPYSLLPLCYFLGGLVFTMDRLNEHLVPTMLGVLDQRRWNFGCWGCYSTPNISWNKVKNSV